MQLFDPCGLCDKPLNVRVDTQMRDFIRRQYVADAGYKGMDERGLQYLRRTIKVANQNGDVPTLWVTPYQPRAEDLLPKADHEARDRRFRAAITELQQDNSLQFAFVDFADIASFGGDAGEFYDGIHMKPTNTAKVIGTLHERGFLTGTPTAAK